MSANPESDNPTEDVEETTAAETAAPETDAENATENAAETTDAADGDAGVEVQTPEFQSFAGQAGAPSQTEIARFHDLKVTVSAELGRTSIPIQQLLSLGSGSVLELDRSIHSPIELSPREFRWPAAKWSSSMIVLPSVSPKSTQTNKRAEADRTQERKESSSQAN